ncbi:hypothetical protein BHE90_009578 [Fusarium euwallaceae]|uniref:Uncharacterized protein n=2 Tax=Fusarium solani species complex TaxID=232080 RepID=A0A3M2S740_9HYPO|nr:hypothetical protein CDV36_007420 [Fusarium kuroshium]RTE75954.1 hypothetical protein BHE90_009578 [Fusarium euwallaceae]
MSSPTDPDADPPGGGVSTFFQNIAHGFNNSITRQASTQTSQPGGNLGISRISCRCHLQEEMAWVLHMKLLSDLDAPEGTVPKWEVYLEVSAHDVPKLMREGFYWSEANVDHERGEFTIYPREDNTNLVRFSRTYYLEDLHEDPQWMAQLKVYSFELDVLSTFRLRNLRVKDILKARAYRPQDHEVYYYHAHEPGHFINAIYDDMPLKGWWPWPKEEVTEDETEDEAANEAANEAQA